jgi:hypothetical protein
MSRALSVLAFLFCLATIAPAQNTAPGAAPERVRAREVSFLGYNNFTMPIWVQTEPEGPIVQVDVSAFAKSQPITYRGGDELRLLRMQMNPQTGQPQPRTVGVINLADLPRETLVILAELSPTQLDGIGVDHSMRASPPGSVRILNITPFETALRLGSLELQLRPNQNEVQMLRELDSPIQLQVAAWRNERWDGAFDGPFVLRAESRALILIHQARMMENAPARVRVFTEQVVNPQPPRGPRPTPRQ